jgi:hypothetical protein
MAIGIMSLIYLDVKALEIALAYMGDSKDFFETKLKK